MWSRTRSAVILIPTMSKVASKSNASPREREVDAIGEMMIGVGWTGGARDMERTPYLSFSDGTSFESLNLVSVPGAACYDWGAVDTSTKQDDQESNPR